jgi:hypothetical protein
MGNQPTYVGYYTEEARVQPGFFFGETAFISEAISPRDSLAGPQLLVKQKIIYVVNQCVEAFTAGRPAAVPLRAVCSEMKAPPWQAEGCRSFGISPQTHAL